jgi:cyclophilin family peptidyl-prolyl cis-trans isomerase
LTNENVTQVANLLLFQVNNLGYIYGGEKMAKRQAKSSLKKRRQEAQRKQMLVIGGVGLFFLVLLFFVWQMWPDDTAEPEPVAVAPLAGDVMDEGAERPLADVQPPDRDGYYNQPPDMVIDPDKSYEAIIHLENGGQMRLRLFAAESPLTVNNFVFLANEGFYDGVIFHRVIPNFMAQGGDPSGTGSGGPGYMFADETDNGLLFDRPALLAMANAGPNTNGSQFFITFVPTPHLNGGHTIFGEIVAGEDVLFGIAPRDPMAGGPADVIARVDIVEGD